MNILNIFRKKETVEKVEEEVEVGDLFKESIWGDTIIEIVQIDSKKIFCRYKFIYLPKTKNKSLSNDWYEMTIHQLNSGNPRYIRCSNEEYNQLLRKID